MKIEIVKIRECPEAIYIGRGSPLGNPFVIGKHGNRDEVCDKYEKWFYWQVMQNNSPVNLEIRSLIAKLNMFEEIKLGCYCAPLRCHGETIKAYLEDYFRKL